MSYEKGTKTSEDSRTETIHCPQYEDINGFGRLFGGRLMEWIDTAAGVCAIRHSGLVVTTAAVDHLEFKSGAYLGDIVVIVAKVVVVDVVNVIVVEMKADVVENLVAKKDVVLVKIIKYLY